MAKTLTLARKHQWYSLIKPQGKTSNIIFINQIEYYKYTLINFAIINLNNAKLDSV